MAMDAEALKQSRRALAFIQGGVSLRDLLFKAFNLSDMALAVHGLYYGISAILLTHAC